MSSSTTRKPWASYGESRPHAVVNLARRLRTQDTASRRPMPWHHLTDAQKVPWILRADAELSD